MTIADLDVVLESDNGAFVLCRSNLGEYPFTGKWLKVVVYYSSSEGVERGTVATFFFTDKLDPNARLDDTHALYVAGQRFRI